MLAFILNTFTIFLKLLIYSSFSNDKLLLKLFTLCFLLSIFYLLYNYPKPLPDNLEVITDYYKIHNKYEKIICYMMIILYTLLFIGGILFLRFQNSSRTVDLKVIINKVYISILNTSLYMNIINIILILTLLVVYILLIAKIIKYFKRYIVKLHIYNFNYDNHWYDKYILNTFQFKYNHFRLIDNLLVNSLGYYKILGFPIRYHAVVFAKYIHYIILLIVVFYDLFFNNLILIHMYNILPYIFIYDLYIKVGSFYYNLDSYYSADRALWNYMYSDIYYFINEEEILLGNTYYTITEISTAILIYLKYELNGPLLDMCRDNNQENSFSYNYYKDWKKEWRRH